MILSTNNIAPSGAPVGKSGTARTGGRRPGRYMAPSPEKDLVEGQIIKGEITDLKNNQVTVTLDDGTKITGGIKDTQNLSIGDTAAFIVEENDNGELTLKSLPKNEALIQSSTINKALEEAGLPKNEKNQSIVRALMENHMPISKQSIQTILKLTYENKEIDIKTLVAMFRLRIPITAEAAASFEQYRSREHSLIEGMKTLADKLPELLDEPSGQGASQGPLVPSSWEAPVRDGALARNLLKVLLTDAPQPEDSSLLLSDSKEAGQLVDILESFPLPERLRSAILSGTASLREVHALLQTDMSLAAALDANAAQAAADASLKTALPIPADEPEELPRVIDLFRHPVIDTVLEEYGRLQLESNELASFLPAGERESLAAKLSFLALPADGSDLSNIKEGTATAGETLRLIMDAIPLSDPSIAKDLFSSPEVKALLKEYIISNWTLTPHALTKEQSVEKLYDKLDSQLARIESLLRSTLSPDSPSLELANQSGRMKHNIDFMKTINEMYTYVQLPVKLKDRPIHSDLYIYARKKYRQDDPDGLRILLHLDMDYLGPLDIHIALTGNQIASKFYLSSDDALELVSRNIDTLSSALMEKGFLFTSELRKREGEIDFVKDFLEQDMPASLGNRYSFDIRA